MKAHIRSIIGMVLCTSFVTISYAFRFVVVNQDSPHMKTMTDLFENTIAPLYGDQTEGLAKIAAAKDRSSYLLLDNNHEPLGVVVFKNTHSEEFSSIGINQALELKTLFVTNPTVNSGAGLGTKLLEHCLHYAQSIHAKNIVVTVSQEKPESLKFFERKGFEKKDEIIGKYKKNISEFILVKQLSPQQ